MRCRFVGLLGGEPFARRHRWLGSAHVCEREGGRFRGDAYLWLPMRVDGRCTMKPVRVAFLAVAIGHAVGCSAHSGDRKELTATASSAVSTGTLTPVPCLGATDSNPGSRQWPGTIAQLLFADALAQCS